MRSIAGVWAHGKISGRSGGRTHARVLARKACPGLPGISRLPYHSAILPNVALASRAGSCKEHEPAKPFDARRYGDISRRAATLLMAHLLSLHMDDTRAAGAQGKRP